ncbi:MAG: extracellular solute-binding protein [Pseudomonadota bacterium]
MRIDRRALMKTGLAGLAMGGLPVVSSLRADGPWSGGGERVHGDSLLGPAKYGPDFKHFGYVNPNAPKGGIAAIDYSAPFDSFNPFITKGTPLAPVRSYIVESLMTAPLDEGSTHYGLIAEWMEHPKDDAWAAFRLRDEARWHDGRPITVADVQKSFELLVEQGNPLYRFYYQNVVKVVDEGDRVVRFFFDQTGNRELPHTMGQLWILPAHYWEGKDFAEVASEPILGSGPYKVGQFERGRYAEFERVPDYWGKDLPVRVGTHNFDTLRFEFFLDRDVAFEAFKKGEIDYWDENSASRWAKRFEFPAINSGKVERREVAFEGPKVVQFFGLNLRREKFADRRTRQAIDMMFDFDWTNDQRYFNQYARPYSYFQGTDGLMATGLPDEAELALLEPFRDQLPPEVFEQPFENTKTNGSGRDRRVRRRAAALLKEAGWQLDERKLVNAKGEPLSIEYITSAAAAERVVGPWMQNLEQLGITTSFRQVDQAQYIRRVRAFDFDVITSGVANSESPGNEQREYWGSASADQPGGRNRVGVKDPVIDSLIETIVFAENREALEAASRALDRVLLWQRYTILQLYEPRARIAFWKGMTPPDPLPARDAGFPNVWWYNAAEAAK